MFENIDGAPGASFRGVPPEKRPANAVAKWRTMNIMPIADDA
jgi:hypothetical protein